LIGRVCSNASLYVPLFFIHVTREPCTHAVSQSRETLSRPSLRASGRETGLKSLLRVGVSTPSAPPTARSLPFSYSSTGDELAFRTSSCKLAGVEWDDGVAGSSSVWTSTECVRAPNPLRRLHLQRTRQLRLSKCIRLLYHPPPKDVCEPSPSKGVERRGGVTPFAELAAAGRWSYGNDRCVGDIATVPA
jgi:hypothetical protein